MLLGRRFGVLNIRALIIQPGDNGTNRSLTCVVDNYIKNCVIYSRMSRKISKEREKLTQQAKDFWERKRQKEAKRSHMHGGNGNDGNQERSADEGLCRVELVTNSYENISRPIFCRGERPIHSGDGGCFLCQIQAERTVENRYYFRQPAIDSQPINPNKTQIRACKRFLG